MKYFNKDSLDYQFIDKFEAGIALSGSDAKSLRTQGFQFGGARVDIIKNYPILSNIDITPYKFAQSQIIDQTRERKLLLSQKEIAKLISYRHQKYMLVPISIYTRGKWIKVEIGVGRKLRKFEKRQQIKDKEYRQSGDARY